MNLRNRHRTALVVTVVAALVAPLPAVAVTLTPGSRTVLTFTTVKSDAVQVARERRLVLRAIDRKDTTLVRMLSATRTQVHGDTRLMLADHLRDDREDLAGLRAQARQAATVAELRRARHQVAGYRVIQYAGVLSVLRQASRVHAQASVYSDQVEPFSEADADNTAALLMSRSAVSRALMVRAHSPKVMLGAARSDLSAAQDALALVEDAVGAGPAGQPG